MSELIWIDGKDYAFAFTGDGNVAAATKENHTPLDELPAAATDDDVYTAMTESIAANKKARDHWLGLGAVVNRSLRSWMTGEAAIRADVIIDRWEQPRWRKGLTNLVVDVDGHKGFLTDIKDKTFILTKKKGRTRTVKVRKSTSVFIPHPTQLKKLAQWQQAEKELGLTQGYRQLDRPIYDGPRDPDDMSRKMAKHAGGKWKRKDLTSRLDALCAEEGWTIDDHTITVTYDMAGGRYVNFLVDCFNHKGKSLTTLGFHFEDHDGHVPDDVSPAIYSESVRTAMLLKSKADDQVDYPGKHK